MPTIETRAGKVAYCEEGTGPPVVLLHATLHDRHDYDTIVPELARRYRTIAVDWPGHGESDKNLGVTAPLCADALEDLVVTLDLPAAIFIGNSVGGFAASRLAITHPERVAGLVLVNTGGFLPQHLPARAFCRMLGTPAIARRVFPRFIHSYMKPRNRHDHEIRDRAIDRAKTKDGAATAASLWRSFGTQSHDLRESAAELHAPTLIVWGSQDTAIPLPLGRSTHRRLVDSQFETIKAGHVVFASEPERFLMIVAPFIESHAVSPIVDRA